MIGKHFTLTSDTHEAVTTSPVRRLTTLKLTAGPCTKKNVQPRNNGPLRDMATDDSVSLFTFLCLEAKKIGFHTHGERIDHSNVLLMSHRPTHYRPADTLGLGNR